MLNGKRKRDDGVIRYVEHFDTGGEEIMQSARALGLEGIVSKKLTSPSRSGRSDNWTKGQSPRRA